MTQWYSPGYEEKQASQVHAFRLMRSTLLFMQETRWWPLSGGPVERSHQPWQTKCLVSLTGIREHSKPAAVNTYIIHYNTACTGSSSRHTHHSTRH